MIDLVMNGSFSKETCVSLVIIIKTVNCCILYGKLKMILLVVIQRTESRLS